MIVCGLACPVRQVAVTVVLVAPARSGLDVGGVDRVEGRLRRGVARLRLGDREAVHGEGRGVGAGHPHRNWTVLARDHRLGRGAGRVALPPARCLVVEEVSSLV